MPDTRHAADRGLSLLGGWQLVVDGQDVALGGREQRLCALLALTGARARAQVAGTLWPESTDARALASLRRALAQTRDRCPGLLVADRTSVGLAPDVRVDVDALRTAAARAGAPDADAALLATLAGDPLLPGWYDEWVEAQRDDLERLRVDALEHLARGALERGDTGLAEGAARAVARIEPWRESASELVIRGLLERGDRAGAVRELERYSQVLRVELGVVPSPALLALVDPRGPAPVQPARTARPAAAPVPVVVPAQRRAPVQEAVEPPVHRVAPSPQPPPPPDPTPPTGPAGLTARAAAVRLAAGAVLVMAASLAIANLGPGPEPASPSAVPDPSPSSAPGAGLAEAVRQVLVRPVAAADGAAAFVVRATRRPARVRVEVADRSGSSVVRTVVVRSRDGQRVVVAGLDGGTYEWSATSPTAPPVVGEVRVVEQEPAVVVAAQQPSVKVSPTPEPSPTPSATPSATPSPTPTPIQQPTQQPTQQPAQQPTQQPSPHPSPTRPGPPSEPTDPATQDPGLVG
jgi:DNA-binding SARP family transcriptional activator